jgi:D-3-phosphoglycerate dehydrogenase / 2-oxoglutarate reductase
MRIAIIDKIHPRLAELLTRVGHECVALHELDGDEQAHALKEYEGIVVRSKLLRKELLCRVPQLKFVGRVGAGVENIDRIYCEAQGVKLLSAPEGNRDGVGELCVAYTLILMKHVIRGNEQVRKGLWLREENRGSDLEGKTVGIIGFGNMGTSFAEKLKGFGVRILAHDKYKSGFGGGDVHEVSLEQLIADSDVISLHLPLNDETRYFADRAFFDRIMKPVYFLNTSRGAIVDTEALMDSVDDGRVIGAALDVLEFERSDLSGLDHTIKPHVQQRLFHSEKLLLTPHIAGVTHEGARKMAEILARKIIEAFPND